MDEQGNFGQFLRILRIQLSGFGTTSFYSILVQYMIID